MPSLGSQRDLNIYIYFPFPLHDTLVLFWASFFLTTPLYLCCFFLRLNACLFITFQWWVFHESAHFCVLFVWLMRWKEVMFNKRLVGFYLKCAFDCCHLFGHTHTLNKTKKHPKHNSKEIGNEERRVQIKQGNNKRRKTLLSEDGRGTYEPTSFFLLSTVSQVNTKNLMTFRSPCKNDWHQLLPLHIWEAGLCVCGGMIDIVNWKGQPVLVVSRDRQTAGRCTVTFPESTCLSKRQNLPQIQEGQSTGLDVWKPKI